ncbi:hypothetical protein, partial [Bordetella genomosp. 5]
DAAGTSFAVNGAQPGKVVTRFGLGYEMQGPGKSQIRISQDYAGKSGRGDYSLNLNVAIPLGK